MNSNSKVNRATVKFNVNGEIKTEVTKNKSNGLRAINKESEKWWPKVELLTIDSVSAWKNGESADNIRRHEKAGGVLTIRSILQTGATGWILGMAREVEQSVFVLSLYNDEGEMIGGDKREKVQRCLAIVTACAAQLEGIQFLYSQAEKEKADREGARAKATAKELLRRALWESHNQGLETVKSFREDWQMWCEPEEIVERFEAMLLGESSPVDSAKEKALNLF